jgi:hypothetical protein
MEEDHLTPGQLATLAEIRSRRGALVKVHRMKKAVANNQAVLPRRADAGRTATTRNMKARAAGRRGFGRSAGVWQSAYARARCMHHCGHKIFLCSSCKKTLRVFQGRQGLCTKC